MVVVVRPILGLGIGIIAKPEDLFGALSKHATCYVGLCVWLGPNDAIDDAQIHAMCNAANGVDVVVTTENKNVTILLCHTANLL